MKTKIISIATMALLLLTLNVYAYHKPAVRHYKTSHRSDRKWTIAAITQNLHFAFAKADYNPKYNEQLDELAKVLIDGNYAVVLRGHADSIGTYVGNWKLSDKRAGSVKSYLMTKGVKEVKIITTPLGSTMPVATNKTREGRQKNRRVEIDIKDVNNT